MANNKKVRIGPVAMSNAAANIFNPPTLTGGVNPPAASTNSYFIMTHLRIVNKTAAPVNASLFIGGTGGSAAGTEFAFSTTPVPANTSSSNFLDWYGSVTLEAADFLTGIAGALTSLTIELEGELGVR
jgi:hypothetical protein